jgi:putative OPT family oligopeptide transporter
MSPSPGAPAPGPSSAEKNASFEPYVPAHAQLAEFTPRALLMGALLGMVFGASSLYLVLKVGITVSASIPVAVISMTLFKLWSRGGPRDATILENNVAQTAGSAGESIAFGVGVTMPAIMILGFDLEITRVMLVAVLGGLLGILMMIPLRRALIVQQHGLLKYPEGTACAEVLKAGASQASRAVASPSARRDMERLGGQGVSARTIFTGFGIGLAYKSAMVAFKGWKDIPEKVFGAPLKSGSVGAEISPELLGVGYIIGPRIASIMCAGGALAYWLLIPLIRFFGDAIDGPLAPGRIPIADMSHNQIRDAYVLYIGAGAVAAGGLISLARALPTIWSGLRSGLRDMRAARGPQSGSAVLRTDRDLSMRWVLIGIFALVIAIVSFPQLEMGVVGALLIVVFGFLFVTVSSRLTGEIGSSSNPISGMTVATLLFTCLIFLALGWTGQAHYVTALSVGAIVCIASSNGGSTSQDLKTGYLVGGTPRAQQIAILIGALGSALLLGPILLVLNDNYTTYVPAAQVAPGLQTSTAALERREELHGPQSQDDAGSYLVWHKTDELGGPAGKYLVDDSGEARYLVDPGINGVHTVRPDGSRVEKFAAPKATLMSYIIKGILDRQLPWDLVLFGVVIAIVLEMCGVASLAFAVGVYLPLSASTPILVGGWIRWLVDRRTIVRLRERGFDEDAIAAETDKSPGVLMASGYIAGGAIAGIVIAIMAGVFFDLNNTLTDWAVAHNPFYEGPHADALALIPFALIALLLYFVGREKLLAGKRG